MLPLVKRIAISVALICLPALAGCQSAKVAQPLTQKLAGNDTQSQMDFWHTLESRPVVSNDEAFHALLLFLDGKDAAKDYNARVTTLKTRRLLPGGFDAPADLAIQRGDLAVALVGALKIKGGLMLHILPTQPRYATRELIFLGLYPPSSERQTFNGAEFLGIMGHAEDYQKLQAKPTTQPGNA